MRNRSPCSFGRSCIRNAIPASRARSGKPDPPPGARVCSRAHPTSRTEPAIHPAATTATTSVRVATGDVTSSDMCGILRRRRGRAAPKGSAEQARTTRRLAPARSSAAAYARPEGPLEQSTRSGATLQRGRTAPIMSKVRIGIIGSHFQAECIAGAVNAMPEEGEVVAVASPSKGHAAGFAKRHGIPHAYTDYHELLRDPQVEMISITAPNRLHAQITIDAARAGKHVVCEKPMCLTLEEADAMIDACRNAGVLLLYAEELFFAPKYVKAKQLADEGAFGRVHLVKQGEKHSGPHSEWFWDVEQSGGGAVMDLGCHGIAFCWWFLGKPSIKSVYSQMATQVHAEHTQGEDEAVTLIEFENGAVGMVESSWNRPGGMDDSIEVFGDKGQTYADMLMGNE